MSKFIICLLKIIYRVMLIFAPNMSVKLKTIFVREFFYYKKNNAYLIDVTWTRKYDVGTGIQRVVNNIFKNIYSLTDNVIPIHVLDNKISTANDYGHKHVNIDNNKDRFIACKDNNKLLLLDSSWNLWKEFEVVLNDKYMLNVKKYAIVYDLLLLKHPEFFRNVEEPAYNFNKWLILLLSKCDGIICISDTVAKDVKNFYKNNNIARNEPLYIYSFHMGVDFCETKGQVRDMIKGYFKDGNVFLTVGTVELRKGHEVILDAFKKLIKANSKAKLLIIGHDGWADEDFKNNLSTLSKDSGHILWIKDASDVELQWAYKNSSALIAASKDEGFGLPLIEAAHYNVPIICSDIPIFREVTGGNADYFEPSDSEALYELILKWLNTDNHPISGNIKMYSWEESAQEVLSVLNDKKDPLYVL